MCLWEMIFPDKNQICKILLSGFRIACCRMNLSIYSVTMNKILMHFFYTTNKAWYYCFCGRCPHPASGIEREFLAIILMPMEQRWERLALCALPFLPFLFIYKQSVSRSPYRTAGSIPDPSCGISGSISQPHFRWSDTASFQGHCHLEIRFSF